jgi:hypothetical protein
MPKVVYTPGQGLVQQAGQGVQLSELPFTPVQAFTSQTPTFSTPGVYTWTAGASLSPTGTLPNPADYPGGMFVFRAGDAGTYYLTASNATAGSYPIYNSSFNGSKLQMISGAGRTVSLISDGSRFMVFASSGSLTTSNFTNP